MKTALVFLALGLMFSSASFADNSVPAAPTATPYNLSCLVSGAKKSLKDSNISVNVGDTKTFYKSHRNTYLVSLVKAVMADGSPNPAGSLFFQLIIQNRKTGKTDSVTIGANTPPQVMTINLETQDGHQFSCSPGA